MQKNKKNLHHLCAREREKGREGEGERERAIAPTASLWTCALIWPLSMAPSAKGLSRRALSMERSTVGLVVFHMGPKNNRQYLVLSIFLYFQSFILDKMSRPLPYESK